MKNWKEGIEVSTASFSSSLTENPRNCSPWQSTMHVSRRLPYSYVALYRVDILWIEWRITGVPRTIDTVSEGWIDWKWKRVGVADDFNRCLGSSRDFIFMTLCSLASDSIASSRRAAYVFPCLVDTRGNNKNIATSILNEAKFIPLRLGKFMTM